MYKSFEIAEKIKELAKEKNIPIRKVLLDNNLSESTIRNMKTSMPNVESIAKIADYFNCTIDEIVGRDILNSIKKSEKELYLTENQKELLQSFEILPEREQIKAIGMIEERAREYQYKNKESSTSKIS